MIPYAVAEKMISDPLAMMGWLWPNAVIYDKQEWTTKSVERNDETFVVAGNQLGKDWIAGYICISRFLRSLLAGRSCRIVTTSVKDDHLRVLWGEIGRFLDACSVPLRSDKGGPLIVKHRDIRLVREGPDGYSYLRGMVSKKGEGMAGHHADDTLGVIDEASGVEDTVYSNMQGWAKRMLIFGNPNSCPHNHFFRKAVREGDLPYAASRWETTMTAQRYEDETKGKPGKGVSAIIPASRGEPAGRSGIVGDRRDKALVVGTLRILPDVIVWADVRGGTSLPWYVAVGLTNGNELEMVCPDKAAAEALAKKLLP